LNTWNSTTQGIPGVYPTGLFNPDYRWEKNKKFESAAEISMFKDRVFLSVAYYSNSSSNQLVNYSLPTQTGASSILSNFPAKVENKGFEIESVNKIITDNNFKWTSSIHITFPKNKLLSFPGIESSSYNGLEVGQSLNIFGGFLVSGVDPSTGVYTFVDKNGQPTATPSDDDYRKNLGNLDPKYYGGFQNNLKLYRFELDIYFEFRKQTGRNYLNDLVFYIPGTMNNQPSIVLGRWTKPGDITSIQKLTTRAGNPAYTAAIMMRNSGAQILYGNASYARLKNASLSYNFSGKVLSKLKLNTARIYCQAQNILTITKYEGSDPETQNLYKLPPLKTFTAGIQITF
ncbi:MAG: SusC/RagA family TonB-linked outer membrane protein, partial [Bacteroidetes bacterium]|nr:SusC/RagA family TonB-linked outer membrane protein [Bacteroidota bacterium]